MQIDLIGTEGTQVIACICQVNRRIMGREPIGVGMSGKTEIWQGTLALMVLKTLETMGPLHGYGIARRIELTSGNRLLINHGTLYPALLKLEQEGYVASDWRPSDNNRRARYYTLTDAGKKRLNQEVQDWQNTTAIVTLFLSADV